MFDELKGGLFEADMSMRLKEEGLVAGTAGNVSEAARQKRGNCRDKARRR